MAIHSSIPPVPPRRDADNSSESQPKADAVRSEDVAQGFRGAMSRTGNFSGSGGQSSGNNSDQGGADLSPRDTPIETTANTPAPSIKPAPRLVTSDPPTPLSPAMLRLQQQGVTIAPTPAPVAKVQSQVRDEKVQKDDDSSDVSDQADDPGDVKMPGQLKPATTGTTKREQTSQTGGDTTKFSAKDDLSPPGKDPASTSSGDASGKDAAGKDPGVVSKNVTAGNLAQDAGRLGKAAGGAVNPAKGLNVRGETSTTKDAKSTTNADARNVVSQVDARIAPQPTQAAAATDGPALTIPSALLQQVVDYATVHQNRDGFYEFQLGLNENMMGGMNIQVTALANRRVGLKVRSARGGSSLSDEDVQGLIAALRSRGVDVVDVDIA